MERYKELLYRRLSIIIVVLLTFSLVACSKNEISKLKEEEKMKGELSVYYVDYADQNSGSNYIFETTLLLQDLQSEYPDLEIKPTTFGSREAFMTQVSTELNTGSGPDLFLLNYATPLNWNKMANNGVYENLTPYLQNDETYKADNYFEAVMKAGKVNNNQHVLPLSFNVMSLFTSKEKLETSGINFETGYSYDDIFSAINKNIEKANENDEIIPLALLLDRMDLITCFMQAFGMPFIDYKENIPVLDKESLLGVCDFLKNLYPYVGEAYANRNDNSTMTESAKKIIYFFSNWSFVGETMRVNTIMKHINQNPVSIVLPKYDDVNESTAHIYHYAAVNSNSNHKQLAYDSAKALMDIASKENIRNNFPVNKDIFEKWMLELSEGQHGNMPLDGDSVPVESIADDVAKIRSMVEDIDYVTLHNIDVMIIINDCLMPYIEGDTKTFDECYEETVNKLNLYINE